MDSYLQFTFRITAGLNQELLIAALADLPFEGFEEKQEELIAYIPQPSCDEEVRANILDLVQQYAVSKLEEQLILPTNWNADWEKNYEPVIVDNFCVVRAAFHPNFENILYQILITPKMSFGTGHHATTYMMISAMESLDFVDKQVLDYGCGTAVLAILAKKLGATLIDAIDNDTWAYQNSLENITLNDSDHLINVQEGDWSKVDPKSEYDIILANINRNVILSTMQNMVNQLKVNGILLCSGFLEHDVELIVESATGVGLSCFYSNKKEQWHCLGFKKEE